MKTEKAEKLIPYVVKKAFAEDTVPEEPIKELRALGLVRDSSIFREAVLFPGEKYNLLYDVVEGDVRQCGRLGFDENFSLISIDASLPRRKQIYLGELRNVDIPTDEVARELRKRMAKSKEAMWPFEVYKLVTSIAIIPCVDAFPVRWRGLEIPEMGFILRNTGFYKGKWWSIGGRMSIGESLSACLQRQVRETIGVGFSLVPGVSWNQPVLVAEHSPEDISLSLEQGEFAGREPTKHSVSSTYLIEFEGEKFEFGSTAHGGQEAAEFRWFRIDDLPKREQIAYGGEVTVQLCARWIRDNL